MSRWLLCIVIVFSAGAPLGAQPLAPTPRLVRSVDSADHLEIASAAAAVGDDEILAGLRVDQPIVVRFASTLASPWMEDPEAALEALSAHAVSRDPDLAPAAAWALWRCAQQIATRDTNSERSGLAPEILETVRERASDASLRPDISRLLQITHALLAGPSTESSD